MAGTHGEVLRRLRKERGLTQEQFADFMGCAKEYISRLEHDRKGVPKLETLVREREAFRRSGQPLNEEEDRELLDAALGMVDVTSRMADVRFAT